MDKRVLSAEQLERELLALESDSISMRAGQRIRDHIAALTEAIRKLPHEPGCEHLKRAIENNWREYSSFDVLPDLPCNCAKGVIDHG